MNSTFLFDKEKSIMNEELKKKVIDLLEYAKTNETDKIIEYIDRNFINNPHDIYCALHSTDFYETNRAIYNFSDNNPTVLIVSYDEGDRIGSKYSNPDIDIYFDLQRESEFNQNHDFFILKKGIFNHDNNILKYLDLITNDYKLTKEDVIEELTTTKYETYIPYHYFKQIPVQILADEDVEDAVMDKIWNVVKTNKNLYVNQYECGRYGGEDVPKWKMSELESFMRLKEEVPTNIRLKYRIRFANEINDYLNSQKKLEDEKEMAL